MDHIQLLVALLFSSRVGGPLHSSPMGPSFMIRNIFLKNIEHRVHERIAVRKHDTIYSRITLSRYLFETNHNIDPLTK